MMNPLKKIWGIVIESLEQLSGILVCVFLAVLVSVFARDNMSFFNDNGISMVLLVTISLIASKLFSTLQLKKNYTNVVLLFIMLSDGVTISGLSFAIQNGDWEKSSVTSILTIYSASLLIFLVIYFTHNSHRKNNEGDEMGARVAKLEADVVHIKTSIINIENDIWIAKSNIMSVKIETTSMTQKIDKNFESQKKSITRINCVIGVVITLIALTTVYLVVFK